MEVNRDGSAARAQVQEKMNAADSKRRSSGADLSDGICALHAVGSDSIVVEPRILHDANRRCLAIIPL